MPLTNSRTASSGTLSLEKALQTAENSGKLTLVNRRLKEIGQLVLKHNFANTTDVDLSKNRFNEIPQEIFQWLSVSSLNLSHNLVKTISDCISELKLLEVLILNNNNLTVLPPQICELQHLTILRLSSNRLISLPEEVGRLKKCQALDVSMNELTSIPEEIAQMSSLLYLNIRKNNIFALPEEISTMQLTNLDASCNLITVIPVGFQNMITLQSLVFDNNPLSSPQLSVLRKGRVHLFRELTIQAEKAQIKKEVMDDPSMSQTKRSNSVHSDMNLIEIKARALVRDEVEAGMEEEHLEKAAALSKDRRKASITSVSSGKNSSVKKRTDKPLPNRQKSAENMTATSQPRTKPKPLAKSVTPKERKRGASGGNFERKSSTDALLIHQKLSGFPGYKLIAENDKVEITANGKVRLGDTKEKLNEFVQNRQALSPTNRNNQIGNKKITSATTNTKKGSVSSVIKPRALAQHGMRGNSFNSEKEGTHTLRRKTEKLHEELETMDNVRKNVEARLKISLGDDLLAALSDGVVLCHLANHARPRSISMIHVPSPAVPKLSPAKRRRNIDNFLDACIKTGVAQRHLCSVQDILLEKNFPKVAITINELLKRCPISMPSPQRRAETPSVKVAPSTLRQQSAV